MHHTPLTDNLVTNFRVKVHENQRVFFIIIVIIIPEQYIVLKGACHSKFLENEFALNWQIWSLFLSIYHPWFKKNCKFLILFVSNLKYILLLYK